jgi:uncharacterized protein YkwD
VRGVRVLAVALVPVAAGCFLTLPPPESRATADPDATAVFADSAAAELERGLYDRVNTVRRNRNLPVLLPDAALAAAARDYAVELAHRGQLSHESDTPNRRTAGDRLIAAGAQRWRRVGENLASVDRRFSDPAAEAVHMWLGSAPHARIMLDGSFTHAGVGAARARNHWYIVQVYVAFERRGAGATD